MNLDQSVQQLAVDAHWDHNGWLAVLPEEFVPRNVVGYDLEELLGILRASLGASFDIILNPIWPEKVGTLMGLARDWRWYAERADQQAHTCLLKASAEAERAGIPAQDIDFVFGGLAAATPPTNGLGDSL